MDAIRTTMALAILATLSGRLAAVEPTPGKEAQARTTLYQAETRTEMKYMHWRIITDTPGRLVGTQTSPLNGPQGDTTASLSLVVTFRPKSKTDTECGINKLMTLCFHSSSNPFQKSFMGPLPQTDARSIAEINGILARARQRMLKAHPEYAAPASR